MNRKKNFYPAQWIIPALVGGTVFGWWLAQASALGSCLYSSSSEPVAPALRLMESPIDAPRLPQAVDPGSA